MKFTEEVIDEYAEKDWSQLAAAHYLSVYFETGREVVMDLNSGSVSNIQNNNPRLNSFLIKGV